MLKMYFLSNYGSQTSGINHKKKVGAYLRSYLASSGQCEDFGDYLVCIFKNYNKARPLKCHQDTLNKVYFYNRFNNKQVPKQELL